jgi:hypothetical protein
VAIRISKQHTSNSSSLQRFRLVVDASPRRRRIVLVTVSRNRRTPAAAPRIRSLTVLSSRLKHLAVTPHRPKYLLQSSSAMVMCSYHLSIPWSRSLAQPVGASRWAVSQRFCEGGRRGELPWLQRRCAMERLDGRKMQQPRARIAGDAATRRTRWRRRG